MTKHRTLETSDLPAAEAPLLRHVAGEVGDPSVRHRHARWLLAHGDPASDLPAAAGLRWIARHQGTERRTIVEAPDFFTGFLETALADDEMVTEIRVPKAGGVGWSYQKFNRRVQDWAIVGVAVMLGPDPKVALNMGYPMRHAGVERLPVAQGPTRPRLQVTMSIHLRISTPTPNTASTLLRPRRARHCGASA